MASDMPLKRALARQTDKGAVDKLRQRERSLSPDEIRLRRDQDEDVIPKGELLDRVGQSGRRGDPHIGCP